MPSLLGLRTLVAVADTGSIRAAADRIGRTPSAVSMMLKQLEGEIGAPLFAGDRKNTLSALGTRVHGEAKALVEHYDRASAAMAAFAEKGLGRCDVAAVPSVAANFLPDAIARAHRRAGPFAIQLRDMDSRAVVEAVADGTVETGICVLSRPRPTVAFEPLFTERLDLVCRRDHPLVRRTRPVGWDSIASGAFIANGSAATIASAGAITMVEQALLQARNVTSLLAMVQAGLGVTVLPRLCRHQSGADIVFLPLADPRAERTVGWLRATEHEPLPATLHLVAALKDIIRERAAALDYALPT